MRVPTEHLVLLEHLPHLANELRHKDVVGLYGILPLKAAKKNKKKRFRSANHQKNYLYI